MAAKPIPEGFHTVTPYLFVKGTLKFLEFLKRAFVAREIEPVPGLRVHSLR